MTIDERLDKITHTLEYILTLQRSHDDHIGNLTERMDAFEQRMEVLTERTIQAMDAINRLARIADNREDRIENLEDRRPS